MKLNISQKFSDSKHLFLICFNCLKCDNVDFTTYADIVDYKCKLFWLLSTTDSKFKCLIFACGLHSPSDPEVHTRILSKIERILTLCCNKWQLNVNAL